MNNHDVFISYAHNSKDEIIVKEIRTAIEELGLKVWIDKESIKWGKSFPSEIANAIRDSQYILLCLSQAYANSSWCKSELETAIAFQRNAGSKFKPHILPLILYDEEAISEKLPILNNIQARIYYNANEVASKIISLGSVVNDDSMEEWQKEVPKKLTHEFFEKQYSWLPVYRKRKIFEQLHPIIPELIKHRNEHLENLRTIRQESDLYAAKHIPAWSRVSVTSSEKGYRLIIGFRNNLCAYRSHEPLGIGCFNCGYYAGTGDERSATISELMQQFISGFKNGFEYREQFDVVEFLGDGSFLNDAELSDKAKDKLFSLLSQIPYIKRILIESTPEHITSQRNELELRLKALREDQHLEIGVGLETSDDFIRRACINKGFSLKTFSKAVKRISDLNLKYKERCSIVAYILVKPAFLTTSESIKDVIKTLQDLDALSKKFQVKITPKLEPAVIPDGTLLSLLYKTYKNTDSYYKPLNYWSVLEILTRAYLDEKCKGIFPLIRIGARDDMDDVLKVPAVYQNDGRYDQFDFILYDAIQEFNKHQDIFKIYAIIKGTYPKGIQHLTRFRSSLSDWAENDLKTETTSILSFISKYESKIDQSLDAVSTRLEASFLKDTYHALDKIEGYDIDESSVQKINKIVKNIRWPIEDKAKEQISNVIYQSFHHKDRTLFNIKVLDTKIEPDGLIRIFFEAVDFLSGRKFPIWSGVPSK